MAKKEDSILQQASQVEKQYKQGLQYKKQMGFLTNWPMYERFKSGDQWPAPTPKTKDLPRPVFNVIKQIEDHKVSSVMNENIKMVYTAMDITNENDPQFQAADVFTRYSDTTWENLKQDQLNEEVLESASNIGTGIWHYYWDSFITGGNEVKWIGDMKGESLDAVNFFPGNPQNRNVQQQPYVIITNRDLVANVRAEAIANGLNPAMATLIKSDSDTEDQAYDMAKKELDGSEKVTVITKYWKEKAIVVINNNGQQAHKEEEHVFFMKVASGVVVKPKTDTGMRLYPIAVMQWERRKRSIFGVGDTEGLIPNQKMVNFLIAMEMLSAQLTGWPKLLIDKNMVKQTPSNTPGEVISVQAGNGSVENGIKYLTPAQMPAHIPQLVDTVISYTKEVAGANETALGEQQSSVLNATAIIALQKQAGIPIESIKRRFYQAVEDIGRIWEEFWKIKYNTTRNIVVKNDQRDPQTVQMNFSQFKDLEMALKIDVGPSSHYSESLMMTSLDKFLDMQLITFEQYLEFAPKNVVPFKDRLLKEIKGGHGINLQAIMQNMTPQEQQAFQSAPPQLQQQMLQQIQQQAPQGQQPQMNQAPPQQAPPMAQPQPIG